MLFNNIFGVYQLMHLELIDTPGQEEYTQLRVHPFQGFVLFCFVLFCAPIPRFRFVVGLFHFFVQPSLLLWMKPRLRK